MARIREYSGRTVYGIDGNLSKDEIMALMAVIFSLQIKNVRRRSYFYKEKNTSN